MTLRRLARLRVKGVGYTLLAVVMLFLLWLIANRSLDERLDPAAAALAISASDHVPDDRNIAIGILGLTAPSGINVFTYGTSVLAEYRKGSWQKMRIMEDGPNSMQPTVGNDQATCWLDPDGSLFKSCLPFDRVATALKDNEQLLGRYRSLYRLKALQADYNYYNSAFLVLNKLAVAEMQLALRRHDYCAAYEKWRDAFAFVRTSLRGTDTWLGKAITMVEFGTTFPIFENLLIANPRMVLAHRAELDELFDAHAGDPFNVHGLVKAEYGLLAHSLDSPAGAPSSRPDRLYWLLLRVGQRNRILNRYGAFLMEYEEALAQPWSETEKRFDAMRSRYVESANNWDLVIDPLGTLFLAIYIDGQLKSRELLKQWRRTEGRLRLATLALEVLDANIADKNISKFLAAARPSLRNPFTNEPMRWDAKNRRIYFPDPFDKCAVISLRVPSLSALAATPGDANRATCK